MGGCGGGNGEEGKFLPIPEVIREQLSLVWELFAFNLDGGLTALEGKRKDSDRFGGGRAQATAPL